MGLQKKVAIIFAFSLVCLIPRVSFADTLTLDTTSGGAPYGEDIFPYQMTLTDPGGAVTTNMSCLNYDREISFGETWTVAEYNVGNLPSAVVDGEAALSYKKDAWLFNQYNSGYVAGIGAVTNSEIQYAIWDVMDSGVSGTGGYDATASALVAMAGTEAGILSPSYFANDNIFVPTSDQTGWTNGQPQIFMTDPAPTLTPEPSSLALLGTGLLCTVGLMRRKLSA